MGYEASPKANALASITQFEVYDAPERIHIPHGPDSLGYIDYFPDTGIAHIVEDRDSDQYTVYNFRTDHGYYEGGNIREQYISRVEAALPALAENDINIASLPQGYPEIDDLLEDLRSDKTIAVENLGAEEHKGRWMIVKTEEVRPIGLIEKFNLFKLDSVREELSGLQEPCYAIYPQTIGPPMPSFGDDAKALRIKSIRGNLETTYPLEFNEVGDWAFMYGRKFVVKDRSKWGTDIYPDNFIFHPIQEEQAQRIFRFLKPTRDPIRAIENGRETFVLRAAIDGLQYARWNKWDDYDRRQWEQLVEPDERYTQSEHVRAMTYEAYKGAITALAERFGEDFFREVAWERMVDHLRGLHSQEIMPRSPYKAHADIMPFGRPWMQSAVVVTGDKHPLPHNMRDSGYVVNAMPLYGDADFWRVIHADYPATFQALAERWLALPDNSEQNGTYATAVVHPRALLRDHFTEAYLFLTRQNPNFTAPLGSIAVKRAL